MKATLTTMAAAIVFAPVPVSHAALERSAARKDHYKEAA